MTIKEIERLRQLAGQKQVMATSAENDAILKKWQAQAQGKRETPTVRMLWSNFPNEVLFPRLQCVDPMARHIEKDLLSAMIGRELFGDDTPLAPCFEVYWELSCSPFGIQQQRHYADEENPKGYHIEAVIEDLADDLDRLRGGSFSLDRAATNDYFDAVDHTIGDLLPPVMTMKNLTGAMTNPLVHLMGMENYYFAMMDYPDEVHEAMEMATAVYENYYDFLEREQILLPTNGITPLSQESFAFTDELPDHPTKTTDIWGFLESQETTAVSPATFGEFVFPYQDRLAKRYGLLSYGCCERVDAIWEDYLSKWDNLRKLSVSPFNDERRVGEYLRGSRVVYYNKPRAEYVTNRGPLDEEATTLYFKGIAEVSSGCLLEVAQREVGTIYGDFNRAKRYVEIAKQTIEQYWKP